MGRNDNVDTELGHGVSKGTVILPTPTTIKTVMSVPWPEKSNQKI